MGIVVFEDDRVERLYPITIGRASYAITCGSFRLVDWLRETGHPLRGVVRPHLNEIQRLDFPDLQASLAPREPLLLVNARLVPTRSTAQVLARIMQRTHSGVIRWRDDVAAAWLTPDLSAHALAMQAEYDRFNAVLRSADLSRLEVLDGELPLYEFPHDAIRYNQQSIGENLEHRLSRGGYREVSDGVFLAEGATLGSHCVTSTQQGPILLDEHATVGPFCYLRGPAYLGRHSRVNEHAAIKDAVSLAHTTKIGGEVEASVVEAYSNKQHHGFLGHSYLGSWINLGAGTCNSDLKNTYGTVKMDYRGEQVATGMQFVGCIMGDYAKTAINTGIFTGKTLGACSMVYGFVTTNVPSFVNYARLFGQVTELTPEVMVATQQRMFLRRKVAQRPCDMQLLHAMYELTRHERQLAGEPLSL